MALTKSLTRISSDSKELFLISEKRSINQIILRIPQIKWHMVDAWKTEQSDCQAVIVCFVIYRFKPILSY